MIRLSLLAVALAVPAAPSFAQNADQDVRCLMASNAFARAEKDAPKRQLAMATGLFYLGRLDGRVSGAQLKAAMVAQAKSLNPTNLPPAMNACVKHFVQTQAMLQSIGKQLDQSRAK